VKPEGGRGEVTGIVRVEGWVRGRKTGRAGGKG
jgi:hypothetical protein